MRKKQNWDLSEQVAEAFYDELMKSYLSDNIDFLNKKVASNIDNSPNKIRKIFQNLTADEKEAFINFFKQIII